MDLEAYNSSFIVARKESFSMNKQLFKKKPTLTNKLLYDYRVGFWNN